MSLSSLRKTFRTKAAKQLRKATLLVTFSLAATGCATQDQNKPEPLYQANITAHSYNPNEMKQKLPTLWQSLILMEKLPLTGKPVYDAITNPDNQIISGIFYTDISGASVSYYINKTVNIADNVSPTIVFHEYFHAMQDIGGQNTKLGKLTQKDALVFFLMTEASAVAYELAARQEAKNHNLRFQENAFRTYSHKIMNMEAFDRGYKAAWRQHPEMESSAREAAALAAGGKEVVRILLSGKDSRWKETYAKNALENIKRNMHIFRHDQLKTGQKYEALRSEIYAQRGYVSPQINLIPDEYLGPHAATYIDQSFRAIGLHETTPPPEAQVVTPPKQAQAAPFIRS